MLHARISGLASYAPDDILDNEMLSKMVDTNDEWITTRVGIKERRILREPGKGSSYLGVKAIGKLLECTGTKPEEVDLLICATSNPDYRFPSTGSVIAHPLGLKNAYAYDIQAACAGFLV
ncbi:MAG: 3-oxoacyl-ACP synthase, partial [Duncaniella sp.]|nr:3-oxoacyl-ACP synthase [Duncaniella sp.]